MCSNWFCDCVRLRVCIYACVWETDPPLSVGVRPNRVQSPTDISRELSTVTTAAKAKPHLDFTMSIFPERETDRQR